MNPKEKQNIEYQIQEKREEKNETLKLPKEDILKSYDGYEDFKRSVFLDPNYKKDSILTILEKADELELQMYFDTTLEDKNFINFNINDFINNFKGLTNEKKKEAKGEKPEKQDYGVILGINDGTGNDKISKTTEEDKKNKEEEQKKGKDNLIELTPKFKEIFAGDKEISDILKTIEENLDNGEIVKTSLKKLVEDTNIRKRFFDGIAKTKDPGLYQKTIQLFTNFGITIPADIPKQIYEIPDTPEPIPKPVVAQFPGAKPQDIEKRGDLVSYGDKTIDLKTGKAFISGEGGYAIETSMKVPNSLDLRVKYQKERLEILDEIKTNEKILNLLENKESLKDKLQDLKKQKSSDAKNASDLQLDIEITAIEKELQKIDEKLKQAVPGYKEEDDKNLKIFLKEKIEESKTSLKGLKEKFDADMQKLLVAGKDEIIARDEKVRETISFLDDLGITNINQHDLQKIIRRININPQAFGFSKTIDLTKGFEGSATESHKQKKEFFNFFSKMYEKMGLTNPPISHSVIEGINKDPRLKNDTTFKQQLEDTGVTLGGALQIETFFTLIKEEPKKEQNTQEK